VYVDVVYADAPEYDHDNVYDCVHAADHGVVSASAYV